MRKIFDFRRRIRRRQDKRSGRGSVFRASLVGTRFLIMVFDLISEFFRSSFELLFEVFLFMLVTAWDLRPSPRKLDPEAESDGH
ncbi:hypothetical protein R1flu_013507 [Riccia fluitans]|uniref:Uncharacterized protein n=1 Tax=Riccia fluitans TaxID=41844 RepID=A0ABD1YDR9_9MARC